MKTNVSRTLRTALAVFAAALLLAGCGGDSGSTPAVPAPAPAPTPAPTPPAPEPEPEEAVMRTYGISYQPKYSTDPLFTLLGAVPYPEEASAENRIAFVAHPRDTVLWEEGGMASEGLKMLAETGDPAGLVAEAEAMELMVLAASFDTIKQLLGTQEITLSSDFPCISYSQRLMPSADWFIGFNACAMDEDGNWVETLEVRAEMYDAGTAEGEPYMDATGPTDPQAPITREMTPPWDMEAISEITGTLKPE